MEQKTKVILMGNGDVTDALFLSDEQLKLLQYLSIEDYLGYDISYKIIDERVQFHEI